jgi:hypothetical protein
MPDWVYNTSPWTSSGAFILGGIVLSPIVILTVKSLVAEDTRRAHNELVSFAITNIAVVCAVLLAFIAVAT